jgi:hypothetical protein
MPNIVWKFQDSFPDLSKEDKEFIEISADGSSAITNQLNSCLSIFKIRSLEKQNQDLIKSNEELAKSNEKYAKWMQLLTLGLVIVWILQIIL